MPKKKFSWRKVRKEVIDKLYGMYTDDGKYEYQGVSVGSETLKCHNDDYGGLYPKQYYQFYSTVNDLTKQTLYGTFLYIPKEIIDNELLSTLPISHFALQAIKSNGHVNLLLEKRNIGNIVLNEL